MMAFTFRRALATLPVALAMATAACAGSAPDKAGWSGRYHYDFDAGKNAAGTGMVVSYTLTLAPGACRFTAEGYQTDETILCEAKQTPAGLDIDFKSYGDGKATDAYGNAEYTVGQALFTLQNKGGKTLTAWKAYPLPDEKPHPTAVYFVR